VDLVSGMEQRSTRRDGMGWGHRGQGQGGGAKYRKDREGKEHPNGGAGAERGDGDAMGVEQGARRGLCGICRSGERVSGSLRAPREGAGRRRVGACERMHGAGARAVDALFNFLIGVV
jgi:hypothetical protein